MALCNNNYYIGLLSGTSMDAIDAAIFNFTQSQVQLIANNIYPIPIEFKNSCLKITRTGQCTLDQFGKLDHWAGELFAQATIKLLELAKFPKEKIIAIGSHGQTLRHAPTNHRPFSIQIGDPNIISEITGLPTVADFRRRDLAAGGQGAPLAPSFHQRFFSHSIENRVIINIGGISNITILSNNSITPVFGFDIGPGNCLMDYWTSLKFSVPFDDNGNYAKQGNINQPLLNHCLSDKFFTKEPPKSTGIEYFSPKWLQQKLTSLSIKPKKLSNYDIDIQATLLALTATTIVKTIHIYAPADAHIYICGGGANNNYLLQTISKQLQKPVYTTQALGIDPNWIEAGLFAWLAQQAWEAHLIANLPAITGAKHAVPLGGIYGITQKNTKMFV